VNDGQDSILALQHDAHLLAVEYRCRNMPQRGLGCTRPCHVLEAESEWRTNSLATLNDVVTAEDLLLHGHILNPPGRISRPSFVLRVLCVFNMDGAPLIIQNRRREDARVRRKVYLGFWASVLVHEVPIVSTIRQIS
jgi:hypothetical protein